MPAWKPIAAIETLKKRAKIIERIREFFSAKNVLEVDTPILLHAVDTNPYIEPLSLNYNGEELYLQTSPEFAMKRLLAAGSGSIYQLCKSFRTEELGRYHNPEFTMLEWYRVGFDYYDLMKEVEKLLTWILKTPPAEYLSYREIFQKYLSIDLHNTTALELKKLAEKTIGRIGGISEKDVQDKDIWLQLLFSECIEKQLGQNQPTFVYDYPASQASLSRIRCDNPPVAERFEVYVKGIELANGFHELSDANEQRKRFEKELEKRRELGASVVKLDENFLAALKAGLPDCAGVALGVDRMIMLALSKNKIQDVLSFDFENA